MARSYTIWDTRSGLILKTGQSDNPQLQMTEEWMDIIMDQEVDDVAFIIDVETGLPIDKPGYVPLDEKFLLHLIDSGAEEVRAKFITNTPSQPAVYMAKEAEALLVVGDPEISTTETPQLNLEAMRTGESRFDCAVVILTQAHAWRQLSSLIEFKRLSAKDAVRAATDFEVKKVAAQVDYSDVLAYLS